MLHPVLQFPFLRFHEITEKWIRAHRQDYRGNRVGDLQDAYIERINKGEETYSAEVAAEGDRGVLPGPGSHRQGNLHHRSGVRVSAHEVGNIDESD